MTDIYPAKAVAPMPEKKPGLDVIRFYIDENLKEEFKTLCSIEGTTMTDNITEYIAKRVEGGRALLEAVKKAKQKQK